MSCITFFKGDEPEVVYLSEKFLVTEPENDNKRFYYKLDNPDYDNSYIELERDIVQMGLLQLIDELIDKK